VYQKVEANKKKMAHSTATISLHLNISSKNNPSDHLAIVGNFVGALLRGIMGLKEGPLFLFVVGLVHYTWCC
jgi:hypothetical protein